MIVPIDTSMTRAQRRRAHFAFLSGISSSKTSGQTVPVRRGVLSIKTDQANFAKAPI
jgi:hypothetical protein